MGARIGLSGIVSERDFCVRCSRELYGFSKRTSASTGELLCISCAEREDQKYMAENVCSICARVVTREAKFVLPSKAYGKETMPLHDRLICNDCYRREYARSTRLAVVRKKVNGLHDLVKKDLISRMMQKRNRIMAERT